MSEVITKQKILIADDSEMNRELLAAILEEEYDIIQVNDGVQAVDCLQRHAEEISLLLLDIVMPHMDGFEVLSYMNKEHWIDAIPVVIISSENSPIYIKRGYDLGATDFIGKPYGITPFGQCHTSWSQAAPNDQYCFQSDLRERKKQQADDQYPLSYSGVPQWGERTSCAAHSDNHRNAPSPAGSEGK